MGWRVVVVKMPVTTCPVLLPFSSYCIPKPAKDFDVVVLSYCLTCRSVLMVNNTFMIEKNSQHDLDVAPNLPRLLRTWRLRRLPLRRLGFCFRVIAIDP